MADVVDIAGSTAQALAAGTNSIPTTAALKVVATVRCVTFIMLPLSFGDNISPEPPCEKGAQKP